MTQERLRVVRQEPPGQFIIGRVTAAGRLIRPFKLSLVTDFAYYVVCAKARADEPDLRAVRTWLMAEARGAPRTA
jgi:LysR family glycine cleavage system transcriptional activator